MDRTLQWKAHIDSLLMKLKNPKTDHVPTSISNGLYFLFPLDYV